MPLSQLLQIVHCAIVERGIKTTWKIPFPGDYAELDDIRARLEKQLITDNG